MLVLWSLHLAFPPFNVILRGVLLFYKRYQALAPFDQVLFLIAQKRVKGPIVLLRVFMLVWLRDALIVLMDVLSHLLEVIVGSGRAFLAS